MIPTPSREVNRMAPKRITKTVAVAIALGILGVGTAYTQFIRGGGTDYNTTGVDAQRTSWFKTDRFISKDSMTNGGFQFQWKLKVENQPRQLTSVIGATTSGGGLTKPLNVINSTSNTLTTVDNDTGIQGWTRHFDVAIPAASTMDCPGGMTANSSRPVTLAITSAPASNGGRGPTSGVGYSNYVGDPGAGLPPEIVVRAGRGAPPPPPPGAPGAAPGGAPGGPAGAYGGPGAGGANGAGRGPITPFGGGRFGSGGGFYVVTSDGVLRTIGDGSGKDLQKPVPFLPANARASDLIAIPENNDAYHSYVIYTATTNGCGGVPNRVWAINMASDNPVITHVDTGASPVGDPAFASNGTLYVAVGKGPAGAAHSNSILALEPKSLAVKDWFTDSKAEFSSSPTIFKQGDKEIVAAATTDGRIYLLDTTSLGGSDHKTPLFVSPAFSSAKTDYVPRALASWKDADGATWIAEPFAGAGPSGAPGNGKVINGGIVALKVADDSGKLSLTPAWVSQDMVSPLPPLVINGVVFAASSGEYHPAAGVAMTASERAQKSVPAVIYALDEASGKQLWSSGKTITSFVAGTPIWASAGQAYIATYDNNVYAFGFAMERYISQQ